MNKKEIISEEQIEQIKEFYQTAELSLPDKPQWRHFLFKLPDNTFKRFHLKNVEELRKVAIMYAPIKIFFSAAAWLNCENIKGRLNNSYPIKIFEDIIFDIDSDNIEQARTTAIKVIDKLGKPDKIVLVARGFHLWYEKRNGKENYIALVQEIPDIDIGCNLNDFNVFALPNTLKKGATCPIITYEELINKDYSKRRQIYIPLDVEETPERDKPNEETLLSHNSMGLRTGTGGTVLAFSNQVKKNIFIPVLIYNKQLKCLNKEISRLAEHYDLGNLFTFKTEEQIAFISLKTMDKSRLKKLLNSSRSLTKDHFKKFGQIWFNFSKFEPVAVINFESRKFFRASLKHSNFLKELGFEVKADEFVGKEKLNINEVKID